MVYLGVLGGLEILRTLNDLGIKTKHPIVVTNWTNEEGTRYAPAMLASGVFAGMHTQDWAYAREDAEGQEIRRRTYPELAGAVTKTLVTRQDARLFRIAHRTRSNP